MLSAGSAVQDGQEKWIFGDPFGKPGASAVQRWMPQTFSHFQGHSPALSPCFQTVSELCSSHPVLLPVSGTLDSCSISFFCQGALLSSLGLDKPERKRVTGSSGRTGALFHPPVRDLKLASACPKHCALPQQPQAGTETAAGAPQSWGCLLLPDSMGITEGCTLGDPSSSSCLLHGETKAPPRPTEGFKH